MNVWPTNSGTIVQARAQVVIGSLMPRVVLPFDLAEQLRDRRTDLF